MGDSLLRQPVAPSSSLLLTGRWLGLLAFLVWLIPDTGSGNASAFAGEPKVAPWVRVAEDQIGPRRAPALVWSADLKRFVLIAGLVSLSLSSGLLIPVADGPPKFNIEATCRDVGNAGAGIGGSVSACRSDEEKARDSLAAKWAQYPAAKRNSCVEGAKLGTSPSYVQVITCLEM